MKFILSIILFICWGFAFSQTSSPTKHQISKLFKQSIDQESKKSITIGSGAWLICNQDSAFYKSDTLKLFSEINYFYQISGCCNFVDWTFYRKNAFLQSSLQICNEPSTHSTASASYKVSYFRDKKVLYLAVTKPQNVEVFEVVSLNDIKLANNQVCKVITLKRLITKKTLIVGHVY